MTDKARWFNWNGGSSNSQIASAGTFPSYTTSAPVATSVAVIPAHYLGGFHAYNTASVPLFIQLFDASAQPASAAVPLRVYPIASAGAQASTGLGGGYLDVDFGDGRFFQTGVVIALSSLASVLEIASVGTMLLDLQFQ